MVETPLPPAEKKAARSLEVRALTALRDLVEQLHLFAPVTNEEGVSFKRNEALLNAEKLLNEIDRMH